MTSSQVQILDKVETEGAFAFDLKCMGRRRHASTQLSGHKCIRLRGAAESNAFAAKRTQFQILPRPFSDVPLWESFRNCDNCICFCSFKMRGVMYVFLKCCDNLCNAPNTAWVFSKCYTNICTPFCPDHVKEGIPFHTPVHVQGQRV